jgi:hypothetical protein
MILAETLASLTSYSPQFLTKAVQQAGYKDANFTSCKFLGITNGGQFCYMGVYPVKGGVDSTKVFLTYNHAEDRVTADTDLTNW